MNSASSNNSAGRDASVGPEDALALLTAGNGRFVSGNLNDPAESRRQLADLVHGQSPYASILCCSDSRVPPELIFDEGFGRLFIVRVAGNVLTSELLASLEYASVYSTSRLIVILGHQSCGAITSAVHSIEQKEPPESPHLQRLLQHLYPVVEKVRRLSEKTGPAFVDLCAEENVRWTAARIREESTDLRQLAEEGSIKIVPAMCSLTDQKVRLLDC